MTPLYLSIIMVFYLLTAIDLFRQHQIGLGLTFLAYAGGNVGLLLAARGV